MSALVAFALRRAAQYLFIRLLTAFFSAADIFLRRPSRLQAVTSHDCVRGDVALSAAKVRKRRVESRRPPPEGRRAAPRRQHERGRYAKATFRKDRRLNIRLSSKDLEAIQKRALAEGLPYQTLIASLLHKYASGRLKEI